MIEQELVKEINQYLTNTIIQNLPLSAMIIADMNFLHHRTVTRLSSYRLLINFDSITLVLFSLGQKIRAYIFDKCNYQVLRNFSQMSNDKGD